MDEKVLETRILLEKPHQTPQKIPDFLQPLQSELQQYCLGQINRFHRSDLFQTQFTQFQNRVYEILCKTQPGETLTYKEIAEQAGSPQAARAVGSAMRRNPYPLIIPCHRVVPAHGKNLGRYSGALEASTNGEATKASLINWEKKVFQQN